MTRKYLKFNNFTILPRSYKHDRLRIEFDGDFDGFELLHSILYYLYTGKIILQSDTIIADAVIKFPLISSSAETYSPTIQSAEDIFSAAKFYGVSELEEKALEFLKSDCEIGNITSRVFGEFCDQHAEVDEIWSTYFKNHLAKIIKTKSYEDYFRKLENTSKEKEAAANAKFRNLVSEKANPGKRRRVN
jgi:hypothetical protein